MGWFSRKKADQTLAPVVVVNSQNSALIEEIAIEKNFDWAHYERTIQEQNIWSDEHRMAPDARVMLSLYARESLVRMAIDAIARQFMGANFTCKDARILALLQKPNRSESAAEFHFANIVMLEATGNLFLYYDRNILVRLPTDRVGAKYAEDGSLLQYTFNAQRTTLAIDPAYVLHIKLPNPTSSKFGLSPLSALPAFVLLDKYSTELSISYYLRGGNLAGVIETEIEDQATMNRFKLSLEQGNGSRRNSFRDKILPKGTKWAGSTQGLSNSLVLDNSKHAQRRILAALGVPPVMVGDTDSVNYANAQEQRASFWRETVMPIQMLYCSGLSKLGADISIDNSKVQELSTFNIRLEQDAKLAPVLTVEERRTRLGFSPVPTTTTPTTTTTSVATATPTKAQLLGSRGDGINSHTELSTEIVEERQIDYRKLGWFEAPDRGFDAVKFYLMQVLEQYLDGETSPSMVEGFAREFATFFAESIRQEMAEAFDTAMDNTFSGTDGRARKIIEEMRNSQLEIAKSIIEQRGSSSFVGFSETMTKRIDQQIISGVESGRSLHEIRLNLKQTFGEEYTGQMRTIANTEFRTAMSIVNEQFGTALGSVAKVVTKRWITMEDKFVRDDHEPLHNKALTGSPTEVKNLSFGRWVDGNPTLRYPRDTAAGAAQVINCRCVLLWEVEEYV